MLSTLKAIVRAPRIAQLNNRYERELDNQFVSYDQWIRAKEEQYMAGIDSSLDADEQDKTECSYCNDSVQVISYADVSSIDSNLADIVVFVEDINKLSKDAVDVIKATFLANRECKVVYGDEDEYNSDRTIRMNPTFRPDWSPDTLTSYLYMGSVVAMKKEIVPTEADDIYELVIKATEGLSGTQVCHIDYVLYHNDYTKALYINDKRFSPKYAGDDLVSIIIPSKDNPEILKQVTSSINNLTTGVTYEIIVIDNGSNDENKIKIKCILEDAKATYIDAPQEFNFSRICNQGVAAAKGQYLLFLNDDIEVRDSKWLSKMMAYAIKPHVGAVGAKLYYPESKVIQHCGITNLRLGPVHKLQYKEDTHVYYDHMNDVDRDVLGVTGACLLIRRDVFDEVGGFDEDLRVAFNDVDLCYKLYEAGYSNVVVNTTHLWHHESLSRGDDESKEKIERLTSERTRLYDKHPAIYGRDPYYHDYLTNDILDSNYTYAYEYEYNDGGRTLSARPKKISYRIRPEWHNECLIISLEQCGSLEYWLGPNESAKGDSDIPYIGGYSFVAGSDNSCFSFAILLEHESGIYEMPVNKLYRPDLEINLDPEERASLAGFSVRPDMTEMPKGAYQVGIIARGLASRMILCRFSNRYIHNN